MSAPFFIYPRLSKRPEWHSIGAPMNGTLALVGSGEYLPPMRDVDRYLLGCVGGEPRVACLPTAAAPDGEAVVARWAHMGVEHFRQLGARSESIPILTRRDADDESLAARIRTANFVYLSGGKPDYLFKTLNDTRAFAAIEGVLERGGVMAGCSAGAMIFGEYIPRLPTLLPLQKTIGALPQTLIIPHYDELSPMLERLVKLIGGGLTLVGVDGNTALVAQRGGSYVVGAGRVILWGRGARQSFRNGDAIPGLVPL